MTQITSASKAPALRPDRQHLPAEEAVEVQIREAVTTAAELTSLLVGNQLTRERLELPGYLEHAEKHEQSALQALSLLAQIERPATSLEISQHLTILLGSLTGSKADPKTFAKMLKVDVVAAQPSIGALEAACRKLRRTKTFVPSIAELLEALEEAKTQMRVSRFHLERLPGTIERARERVERYRVLEEDERERRKRRIREDLILGRLRWDYDPEEVATVRAELEAEGIKTDVVGF